MFGCVVFAVVAFYVLRTLGIIGKGGSGRLNAWGLMNGDGKGKGYFQIGGDEKGLGLLGGSSVPNGKAD